MPQYIRHRQSGGTYFFTTRLADRSSTLLSDEIDRLRDATRKTIERYPFTIEAIAVLPAAIHTLWTLPHGDNNFALRWSMLKSQFSKGLPDPIYRSPSQQRRRDKGIWHPQFWNHLIRDTGDFETHLHMIHTSPVQAGHCSTPQGWPHSSVHRQDARRTAPRRHAAQKPEFQLRARTYREEGFAHHP